MKNVVFALIISIFFVKPVFADDTKSPLNGKSVSNADVVNIQTVDEFVNKLNNDVIDIMKSAEHDDKKEKQLVGLFKEYIDADWMGRYVLGRYRKRASKELLSKYLTLYQEYLIKNYIPQFRNYETRGYKLVKTVRSSANTYTSLLKIESLGEDPSINVKYRVRKDKNNNLKIIDIEGEGVSLLATQRSDFAGMIGQKGIEYFVDKLEQKVQNL